MPYITREDGEHFVIPSYRDVLSSKQKNTLKKEIMLLSQSYGEYITLQRKGPAQYEVAFSPDTGYLLGESIWHHFQRPLDMIYCEAIPNTTEAILVIVKAGSVYLDGSFPLESIPEELIIFLTQQNNFEIYIYGDVPISEAIEEGKFSFEPTSVKSFTILDKPVFSTLPLLRIYQLQLVDTVLKTHGIGVFPLKQLIAGLAALGFIWMAYSYLTAEREELPPIQTPTVNPYQTFNIALISPAPDQLIQQIVQKLILLYSMPGWLPTKIELNGTQLITLVSTPGGRTEDLFHWAELNHSTVEMQPSGIYVQMDLNVQKRPLPTKIYPLKNVIGELIDRLSTVYPGNHLALSETIDKGNYQNVVITIRIDKVTPEILVLIGDQLKDLPFVMQSVSLTIDNGVITGNIIIQALGS
jgi:hypothetical protein